MAEIVRFSAEEQADARSYYDVIHHETRDGWLIVDFQNIALQGIGAVYKTLAAHRANFVGLSHRIRNLEAYTNGLGQFQNKPLVVARERTGHEISDLDVKNQEIFREKLGIYQELLARGFGISLVRTALDVAELLKVKETTKADGSPTNEPSEVLLAIQSSMEYLAKAGRSGAGYEL